MNKPKRNYNARVEYRAIQEVVEKKLADGYRVLPIFEELTHGGRISMSYSTFCAYVRGQGERKPGLKKMQMLQLKNRPQASSRLENQPKKSSGFSHEKLPDLDELGPPKKAIR